MSYWMSTMQLGDTENAKSREVVWGDLPADIMDRAVDMVVALFVTDLGRMPTREEIVHGAELSANILHALTMSEAMIGSCNEMREKIMKLPVGADALYESFRA